MKTNNASFIIIIMINKQTYTLEFNIITFVLYV